MKKSNGSGAGRNRRVLFVTGSRAEYGLLRELIKVCKRKPTLDVRLLVTGTHLANDFGLTYREIEEDGIDIDWKTECLLSSDSPSAITKSMGLVCLGCAEAYAIMQPDLLVVLGDRYEILAAVSAALAFRIPVAHIHGGEVTRGALDDTMRHAITKLSHLHFVATEAYRDRVIQMGESPERVFNVGALGVDSLFTMPFLSRGEIERQLGVRLGAVNILVTFHPATLDAESADYQFGELLAALESMEGRLFITKTNADHGGRSINAMIDDFVSRFPERASAYASLGRQRYVSLMKLCDVVVGNSSSGIIEAPSLGVPTVNVGDRQEGRVRAMSVVDCAPRRQDILAAVEKARSIRAGIRGAIANPYGKGGTSEAIAALLETIDLSEVTRKAFVDFAR
jgi:UDP-hydrolysing UDP-N-acetyl-D-glucosamine 2-epimerase